jgi:anti-anti-sigma factor
VHLHTEFDPDRRSAIVTMSGEFDLSNADDLRDCLAELTEAVTLDMTAVTFIDSTALSVLAFTAGRGVTVTISSASDVARRVLEISGLDNLLAPPPS